jgi:uncharacterized membrane protein
MISGKTKGVPTTYRIARITVFSALSVVGSFIHLPGPVQTVAFDSAPGFFAALYFGPFDGATVCGIGHLATSVVNGFPLGILHLPIALGLGAAGWAIGFLNQKSNFLVGIVAGIAINTGLIVLAVPALGLAGVISFLPFLLLAACANGFVASVVYLSLRGRRLV